MTGTSATTGRHLGGLDHLRQSIADILRTPIGSRVMRRDYGSRLFELVDRPTSPSLMVDIYAATADALRRWEPRFKVARVSATVTEGAVALTVTGRYLPSGQDVTVDGVRL